MCRVDGRSVQKHEGIFHEFAQTYEDLDDEASHFEERGRLRFEGEQIEKAVKEVRLVSEIGHT